MNWKKKLLKKSRLYVIIDKEVCARKSLLDLVRQIKSGTKIIQCRDKSSRKEEVLKTTCLLRKSLKNCHTLFIVNDYLDVARISDCDGIHLGQGDTSLKVARKILGRDKIIGISCHNLKEAQAAQENGADYISIGPIFSTSLKPDYKPGGLNLIKKVAKKINIPVFAIGGIDESNIKQVLSCGAKRVAVCRAVCSAKNPDKAVRIFNKYLNIISKNDTTGTRQK